MFRPLAVKHVPSRITSRIASSLGFATPAVLALSALTVAPLANAGTTFNVGDTSFSVGAGMRVVAKATEDAAPNGDTGNSFNVDSIRLYFGGKITDQIKFTFNTEEIFGSGPVDVLDAIVQFEFDPKFNLWLGRMLTPADRIEMNGPYYGLTWNQYTQPLYASDQGGAAGTYGRDDGMTVWGTLDKFQYAIGAFNGVKGYGNAADNVLWAGRFAYNFLNMEGNPAFYTSGTYYGKAGNVLTLGVSFQSQNGGTGSVGTTGDFSGYTVDLLSETVLDSGYVVTIDTEYKDFSADYTPATPAPGNCFCLFDGKSYYGTVALLFPEKVGVGMVQPYLRYVKNKPTDALNSDLTEAGINYVIAGHNARLNLNYNSGDANISGYPGKDVSSISFGAQLQF